MVGGEPAFDEAMIGFCRWAADYYQAPLGEVLRAALPQGEQASADAGGAPDRRAAGERSSRQGSAASRTRPRDPVLARAGGGGRRAAAAAPRSASCRAPRASCPRLVDGGLVEVGDEVQRSASGADGARCAFADAATRRRAAEARGARKRVLLGEARGGAATGCPSPALSAAERTHAARAGRGGAGARRAPAGRARPGAARPPRRRRDHAQRRAGARRSTRCRARWRGGFASFLLHGVTGSGKTEVYLRVIAAARAAGRGALVLVPEIALTPQLAARFRARFGEDVAVLHSALPPRERLAAWRRLRAGEVGIALGARSAVFAPVRALGRRGRRRGARPVVQAGGGRPLPRARPGGRAGAARGRARDPRLGDAVARERPQRRAGGASRASSLPERATPRPLPEVDDRRSAPPPARARRPAVGAAGRRAGRRAGRGRAEHPVPEPAGLLDGAALPRCGHVVRCPNCAVSMTYHRGRSRLVCHYCGRTTTCPSAARRARRRGSSGWASGPSAWRRWCASASRTRASRGSIATRPATGRTRAAASTRSSARMHAGEIDVLVGTQMVTKGHDFPGVTLVGVLQPDQAMNLPDFRAAERTFQLLEQVAGRAGRGDRPGRVIVQTYAPDHPAIVAVATHDYEGFVRDELADAAQRRLPAVLADDRAAPRRARRGRGAGRGQGGGGRGARGGRAGGDGARPGGGAAQPVARAGPLAGLAVVP